MASKKFRCKQISDQRTVDLSSLRQLLESPKLPRSATFLIHSIFKLVILNRYKFELLHHDFSLENSTIRGVLRWETDNFVLCIGVLIVQSFQKKQFIKNFSRHSISFPFVTQNSRLQFFHQCLNEKNFGCENILDGIFVDFVPRIGILIVRFPK